MNGQTIKNLPEALDHLEQIFEERVLRALRRLGVPTRDDLQGIARRLQEINEQIRELAGDRQTIMTAQVAEFD
ncbi:MAG: phasin family protein, partial [Candidatus Competibacteraceae bacterium]|nr:phasin family protein [Candidatus Competibacteraceae bacterium]